MACARLSFLCLLLAAVALCIIPASGSAAELRYGPASLSFIGLHGSNPDSQTIYASPGLPGQTFTPEVMASTSNGGDWLSVSVSLSVVHAGTMATATST